MSPLSLIIHGGAGQGRLTQAKRGELTQALRTPLGTAFRALKQGASAVETVALAVQLLEDDPHFNAGKGSKLQSDGRIRMSAAIMDGHQGLFAGCMNVELVRHPIRLAQTLLKHQDRVLGSDGALRFAKEHGLDLGSAYTTEQRLAWKEGQMGKSGTVGAVALDRRGRMAAATSTGGRGGEWPHRISDSATVAGNYASSKGAISMTGFGEHIVDAAAAARISAWLDVGLSLEATVARLFREAKKQRWQFGLIALDRSGRSVARTSTQSLIWARADLRGETYLFNSKTIALS